MCNKLKSLAVTRLPGKLATALIFSAVGIAAMALAAHVSFARQSSTNAAKAAQAMEPVPALTPFVEEHAHFDETDPQGSVRAALAGPWGARMPP